MLDSTKELGRIDVEEKLGQKIPLDLAFVDETGDSVRLADYFGEGKPVKLLMSSVDVIHSFFVPNFRVKMDVLPNRYTVTWFEATREGEFPLYCAEYCGKGHSEMLATVRVVNDSAYAAWLEASSFWVKA